MPELIRAIATRLRERFGNRRRAPRHRVRLPVSVSPLENKKGANGARRAGAALEGYTRDISSTGLALVVPVIRIGDIYLTEGRTLEILIEHESGPVVIYATAVRYEKLEEETADKGYLLGLRITEMSDDDRARLNEYLDTLA